MWLSSREAEGAIPAIAREVSDVTGAGDTVVATLANHTASVVIGKFGPATVTRDELLATF